MFKLWRNIRGKDVDIMKSCRFHLKCINEDWWKKLNGWSLLIFVKCFLVTTFLPSVCLAPHTLATSPGAGECIVVHQGGWLQVRGSMVRMEGWRWGRICGTEKVLQIRIFSPVFSESPVTFYFDWSGLNSNIFEYFFWETLWSAMQAFVSNYLIFIWDLRFLITQRVMVKINIDYLIYSGPAKMLGLN